MIVTQIKGFAKLMRVLTIAKDLVYTRTFSRFETSIRSNQTFTLIYFHKFFNQIIISRFIKVSSSKISPNTFKNDCRHFFGDLYMQTRKMICI